MKLQWSAVIIHLAPLPYLMLCYVHHNTQMLDIEVTNPKRFPCPDVEDGITEPTLIELNMWFGTEDEA